MLISLCRSCYIPFLPFYLYLLYSLSLFPFLSLALTLSLSLSRSHQVKHDLLSLPVVDDVGDDDQHDADQHHAQAGAHYFWLVLILSKQNKTKYYLTTYLWRGDGKTERWKNRKTERQKNRKTERWKD